MPKIKHIAIATQDAAKTAAFYKEVFGLREIAQLESANANGYFLSDGNVNMAILDFQNDAVAGERGKDYSGIHHIGFAVDDLETQIGEITDKGYEIIGDPGVGSVKFRASSGGASVAEVGCRGVSP